MSLLIISGLAISLLTLGGMSIFQPFSAVANNPSTTPNANQPYQKSIYTPQPVKKADYQNINVEASSAIIYDLNSGITLYEKSPQKQRPIASMAKLMTALVIMQNHSAGEIVTIGNIPTLNLFDQKIGISPGEKFQLLDLMKALLIYSGNDVANALAIYDSGSIDAFAEKMNAKASEWGLDNSKFANPSGLDQAEGYSSAEDVLTLARILYNNKLFQEIVSTTSTKIYNQQGKGYTLTTTNKILGTNGVVGIKTGYTLASGECLVTLAVHEGHGIVTVLLNSPDRFQESKSMIDWAFKNYIWQ